MNCDYTSPGGTPLERLAKQQAGNHPAPCARSCEANAYEIQIRRLSAERDALAAKLAELDGQDPVAWVEVVSTHEGPYNFERMALLGKGNHLLYARPVPAEPVNVEFGMRGENMFFKIGNQSFLLDYKPAEPGEFEFMQKMLLSAFSRITHGVKTEIQPVNTLLLTALKACRNKLAHYAAMVAMADVAIMAAEAAPKVCESRQTPGTGSVAILQGAADAILARGHK